MVYQVPPAKKSKAQDKFEFEIGGKTHSLPLMKLLPPRDMALMEGRSLNSIRDVFEQHAPGVFDQFENTEQLEGLTKAWAADSGLDLGESPASSDS
jgi:hypothetical protein